MSNGGPLTIARAAFACDGSGLYFAEGFSLCHEPLHTQSKQRTLLATHSESLIETIVASTATQKQVWPLLSAVADEDEWERFRPNNKNADLKIIWSIVASYSASDGLFLTVHPLVVDHSPTPSCTVLIIEPSTEQTTLVALDGDAQGGLVLAVKTNEDEAISFYGVSVSTLLHLAASAEDGRVPLKSVLTHKECSEIGNLSSLLFFAQGGSTIAAVQSKTELTLIDKLTGVTRPVELPGDSLEICAVAVNPTGTTICVADKSGRLLWAHKEELATSKRKKSKRSTLQMQLHTQHWHDHALTAIAFTPSGDATLSAGEKGTLCVWSKINQSGMSRTTMKQLGAPIVGLLTVPCPSVQVVNPRALDLMRSFVVLCLASNSLAVVDTARLEVVKMIEGISTPCLAPESLAISRLQRGTKRATPPACGSAACKLMRLENIPDCVAHTTIFPRTDKFEADVCDVGQVDLLKINTDSDTLNVSGRLAFRERLEWSRQGDAQWQSFWRSRQVCLTPDMSALLVAESQKCEGKEQRHRLVFSTTGGVKKDSLKVCARLLVDHPVSSLCHIPVKDCLVFAVGSANGQLALYRWEETDAIQTFRRILFQEMTPGQRICDIQATADHITLLVRNRVVTYKLPEGVASANVLRLADPSSIGVATKEKALPPVRAGKTRESSLENVNKFLEFNSRGVVLGLHDGIEIQPNREDAAHFVRHRVDPTGHHIVSALACVTRKKDSSLLIAVGTSNSTESENSLILLEYVDGKIDECRRVAFPTKIGSLMFLRGGAVVIAVASTGGWYTIEKVAE